MNCFDIIDSALYDFQMTRCEYDMIDDMNMMAMALNNIMIEKNLKKSLRLRISYNILLQSKPNKSTKVAHNYL